MRILSSEDEETLGAEDEETLGAVGEETLGAVGLQSQPEGCPVELQRGCQSAEL